MGGGATKVQVVESTVTVQPLDTADILQTESVTDTGKKPGVTSILSKGIKKTKTRLDFQTAPEKKEDEHFPLHLKTEDDRKLAALLQRYCKAYLARKALAQHDPDKLANFLDYTQLVSAETFTAKVAPKVHRPSTINRAASSAGSQPNWSLPVFGKGLDTLPTVLIPSSLPFENELDGGDPLIPPVGWGSEGTGRMFSESPLKRGGEPSQHPPPVQLSPSKPSRLGTK